ncbi:MAG TPA: hypothetical protein VHK88_20150 [Aquihabitans sp.]|nr:hypothetical protein [Aquihabitans sp.]
MIRRLRHGAPLVVDVARALGQLAALVVELTVDAWLDLRARDRRRG